MQLPCNTSSIAIPQPMADLARSLLSKGPQEPLDVQALAVNLSNFIGTYENSREKQPW
jgi:hypothetical protein